MILRSVFGERGVLYIKDRCGRPPGERSDRTQRPHYNNVCKCLRGEHSKTNQVSIALA
ncbi:hypothetical protein PS723_00390 [Pseudomonas fluorescens]|uniref:Uncharacterized protein n=1 Tax=Pseudomonas fluorescens TaxID=294 RepID=A0A5E6ZY78_PSEFL|nr:hypothetical protein PS723_00390 [Pseudomonas fluorescens]